MHFLSHEWEGEDIKRKEASGATDRAISGHTTAFGKLPTWK